MNFFFAASAVLSEQFFVLSKSYSSSFIYPLLFFSVGSLSTPTWRPRWTRSCRNLAQTGFPFPVSKVARTRRTRRLNSCSVGQFSTLRIVACISSTGRSSSSSSSRMDFQLTKAVLTQMILSRCRQGKHTYPSSRLGSDYIRGADIFRFFFCPTLNWTTAQCAEPIVLYRGQFLENCALRSTFVFLQEIERQKMVYFHRPMVHLGQKSQLKVGQRV